MLILDWNSHAPGPGEETGIDSLSVPGPVGVGSVRSSRGFTVSVSDSFCFSFSIEFITICFPSDILWS